VKVIKADLERDKLDLADNSVDCAVFTEVLEHLNPYYVSHAMSEINKVLKLGGKLILTTPNIASLFRRLRLLLGIQPQYVTHVHEYTKKEVEELLKKHGFRVIKSLYSEINDLTLVNAEPGEHMKIEDQVVPRPTEARREKTHGVKYTESSSIPSSQGHSELEDVSGGCR